MIFFDEGFFVRDTLGLALELVGFFALLADRLGDDDGGFFADFGGETDLDIRLSLKGILDREVLDSSFFFVGLTDIRRLFRFGLGLWPLPFMVDVLVSLR